MLRVDKKLVEKLPKYAQSWKWIQLEKNAFGISGRNCYVDAICEPLEDDEEKDQVAFTCDNWEEFIWWVRQYKKSHRRMN